MPQSIVIVKATALRLLDLHNSVTIRRFAPHETKLM